MSALEELVEVSGVLLGAEYDAWQGESSEDGAVMVSGVDAVEDDVFLGVTEGVRASVGVWGGDGCARVGGDVIHAGPKAF